MAHLQESIRHRFIRGNYASWSDLLSRRLPFGGIVEDYSSLLTNSQRFLLESPTIGYRFLQRAKNALGKNPDIKISSVERQVNGWFTTAQQYADQYGVFDYKGVHKTAFSWQLNGQPDAAIIAHTNILTRTKKELATIDETKFKSPETKELRRKELQAWEARANHYIGISYQSSHKSDFKKAIEYQELAKAQYQLLIQDISLEKLSSTHELSEFQISLFNELLNVSRNLENNKAKYAYQRQVSPQIPQQDHITMTQASALIQQSAQRMSDAINKGKEFVTLSGKGADTVGITLSKRGLIYNHLGNFRAALTDQLEALNYLGQVHHYYFDGQVFDGIADIFSTIAQEAMNKTQFYELAFLADMVAYGILCNSSKPDEYLAQKKSYREKAKGFAQEIQKRRGYNTPLLDTVTPLLDETVSFEADIPLIERYTQDIALTRAQQFITDLLVLQTRTNFLNLP